MIIFKARLETTHFSFEAYGLSDADAREAFNRGVKIHAQQMHVKEDWVDHYIDDLTVLPMHTGQCYRDGTMLQPKEEI